MDEHTPRTGRDRRIRIALLAVGAVALVAAAAWGLLRSGAADEQAAEATEDGAARTAESAASGPMSLTVDTDVEPTRDTVPGIDGTPQPVGRLTDPEGYAMDMVLAELVVSYDASADIDGFLAAVGGEIIDTFDDAGPDPDGITDALVRIDDSVEVDAAAVAAALAELEDDLGGEWSVSNPALVPLLHATTVAPDYGLVAIPHGVYDHAGIAQGETTDGTNPYGPNAFDWPYIASGTVQDVGVDVAWRLLADHDKLDEVVPIMVVDQGFRMSEDFPERRSIRRGDWDTPGWGKGSWHGTHVVLAGMAVVDNGFGGAGPAGPVAELIAVEDAGTSWANIRSLRRLVDELRPPIINMSFGRVVTTHRVAHQDFYDRQFRRMKQDFGALPFAAAGNDNVDLDQKNCPGCRERFLIMPCEASSVACVGGYGDDTTQRAVTGEDSGSNWGTATGGGSVEIWGPYFTVSESGLVRGTSMASPFVAGVAALVKAADPSLGPDDIWNILKDTAHDQGDVGPEVTGHQRRINARDAVATALGVQLAYPDLRIDAPSPGAEVHFGEWVDLLATATDYRGQPLPVLWSSSIDGTLADPAIGGAGTDRLSTGEHTISVSTTDALGMSASTGLNLTVLDPTPEVEILAPTGDVPIATTQPLTLSGTARDTRGFNLPAEDVQWGIRRDGQAAAVATATGELASIPAGTLPAGEYLVVLIGNVAGSHATDEVSITVVEPEPGKEPPVIVAPVHGTEFGALPSDGMAPVHLVGYALDSDGQEVSGTLLRWTARSKEGAELVLCAGDSTPGGASGGGDGLAFEQTSCADVQAELPLGQVGFTTWTLTLEVYEAGSLRGRSDVGVTLRVAVG